MKHNVKVPPQLDAIRRPYVIAHRGNRVKMPENGMAAFKLALDEGADALETDLRITKDRVIVCHHDETVERMTDGSGSILDMTLDEVKQLRLRAPDGTMSNEQIPTLTELLSHFGTQTYFLLELKAPQWTDPADVNLLLQTLDEYNALDNVTIASFDLAILDAVMAANSDVLVSPIFMFNVSPPAKYPMIGVSWPMLYVNPLYVWMCRRRGQIFCPLDPTPESRLPYYLRLGVDFVLSDDPEKTINALKALSMR